MWKELIRTCSMGTSAKNVISIKQSLCSTSWISNIPKDIGLKVNVDRMEEHITPRYPWLTVGIEVNLTNCKHPNDVLNQLVIVNDFENDCTVSCPCIQILSNCSEVRDFVPVPTYNPLLSGCCLCDESSQVNNEGEAG